MRRKGALFFLSFRTRVAQARFTCDAENAYGAVGLPPVVSAGSSITFDVDVLDYRTEEPSRRTFCFVLFSLNLRSFESN